MCVEKTKHPNNAKSRLCNNGSPTCPKSSVNSVRVKLISIALQEKIVHNLVELQMQGQLLFPPYKVLCFYHQSSTQPYSKKWHAGKFILQELCWGKIQGNPYINHLGLFSTITGNTFWFQMFCWCFAVNVKCNHFLNSAFHSYIQPWFLQPQGWWCLIVVNKKWLVLLGSCNRSTVLYFFNSCLFVKITPEEWEILYV